MTIDISNKIYLKYLPHGVNETIFHKITDEEGLKSVQEIREKLFGQDKVDFVLMYNSRNIRRKMTSNIILAYNEFFHKLPHDKAIKTRLLLHTERVDENGTDLPAVIKQVTPAIEKYVVFTPQKYAPHDLNKLYNIADVVINLANAEGFGIPNLEAMMAERMVIINVTGGLQDQVGFCDEEGNLLHQDIHFNKEWGTNSDGKYQIHGEWAEVCFPTARSLIGSVPTPFINEDHADWNDAADKIMTIYNIPKDERERHGAAGRQYAIDNKMTAKAMCQGFIDGFNYVFENWKTPEKFTMVKV